MCSTQKSSVSWNSWLALLAIGILLCTSSLALGDNPNFPPPADDSLPTTADVLVQIGPQTLDLRLLGERTGTIVRRGPRINPPGPPPPYPYIETELVMLSLTGVSPMGPVNLMLNPAAPPSLGRATALQEPPDLPALSFFDVFVEIDLPMLGMRLVSGFPQQPGNPASIQPLPVRVVNESLRCVPPGPGERFCTPIPFSVPLTDLQTGQIVGQILRVWHTIIEPNHYKVWRVQPVPFVPPITAVAKDQFGSNPLQLNQIDYLSNPVQKTVDGKIYNIFRPDDHLNWYHINIPAPPPPLSVLYKNQFESTAVIIDNLVYFCVPTRKFPHPAPQRMDHYTGYRIQNPSMIRKPVQLQDQFDFPNFEFIDSLLPLFLFAPAQKNSEPVYDTVTHYVAYRLFPQDIDTRTLDTEDQFGIHAMNVQQSEFLMVPTRKLGFTPAEEACCYTGPGGSLICALVPAGQCVPVFGGTVVAACLGDGNGNGIDDACEQPPTDTGPNHYKTWRIVPQTFQRTVFVEDQFVRDSLRVVSIDYLANPVRKVVQNDTFNIVDPDDHLTWYRAFGKNLQRDVEFRNQFERDTVRIDSVQYLLLPTQKSPHPPADSLDHYKAYRIKNPHELLVPVELRDQFDVLAPENINTLIQRYFLTPARKNNELRYDTLTHYLAYEIFPKRTSSEVRQTADQFGGHVLQVQNSELLLVPTTKIAFCPCDMGDLNCDAVLTSADVVLHLNRTFLGIGTYPPCVPDLNCDGILTSADVVILLNMTYLGTPPGC